MRLAVHAGPGPGPKLIPTVYYGSTDHFVFKETPWLPSVIDGVLFYFGMQKLGRDFCSKVCASSVEQPSCDFPCFYETCTNESVQGLADEIQDFVAVLPATYPIHVVNRPLASDSSRLRC